MQFIENLIGIIWIGLIVVEFVSGIIQIIKDIAWKINELTHKSNFRLTNLRQNIRKLTSRYSVTPYKRFYIFLTSPRRLTLKKYIGQEEPEHLNTRYRFNRIKR